eukprot:672444-Pleurochrysis_carterae.AAC.1
MAPANPATDGAMWTVAMASDFVAPALLRFKKYFLKCEWALRPIIRVFSHLCMWHRSARSPRSCLLYWHSSACSSVAEVAALPIYTNLRTSACGSAAHSRRPCPLLLHAFACINAARSRRP